MPPLHVVSLPHDPPEPQPPSFRDRSIALALYRMLTGSWYNIVVVRDCLRLANIEPPHRAVQELALHHTAVFADLPPAFAEDLIIRTLDLFRFTPPHETPALLHLAATAGLPHPAP